MRGIAALAVGFLHTSQQFAHIYRIRSLFLAVDFFFCLSGFVLAYSYQTRIANGEISWLKFARLRLIRLYPLYAAGMLIGGAVALAWPSYPIRDLVGVVIASLGMFPIGLRYGFQAYSLDSPLWSIVFELIAGLIFAALAHRGSISWCVLALLCLVALVNRMWPYNTLIGFGYEDWRQFAYGILRIGYPFGVGVLICRLRVARPVATIHPFVPVSLLLLVLFAPQGQPYEGLAAFAGVPLAVLTGAYAKVTSRALYTTIGAISFPFYALHEPILIALQHTGWSGPVWIAPIIILLIGIAYVAHIVFERPVARWLSGASRHPVDCTTA